jgi:hypothetical protein
MTDDADRRGLVRLDEIVEVVERIRPANGRSRKKMRQMLALRVPDIADRESPLEDFVLAALVKFRLPTPIAQYPVMVGGRLRRIDLCYPDGCLALEAKGFQWYKQRTTFDRDALRGNELQLAGYRVLSFTSAFSDWQIATQVAEALGLPAPGRKPPLTFSEWTRRQR